MLFVPKASRRIGFLAALIALLSASAVSTAEDQATLLAILKNGTTDDRDDGVDESRTIPMDKRDANVLPSILRELDREAAILAARRAADLSGSPLPSVGEGEGEYLLDLLSVVVQYKD